MSILAFKLLFDAANPGDIVEVHSGTYEGDVNIEEDSITLRGVDTGGGCPNLDGGVTSNSVPTGCWGTLKGPWMIQSAVGPNATVIGKRLPDVKLSEGKVLEKIHNASEIGSLIQIALNERDNSSRRDAIEALICTYDSKAVDPLIQIVLNETDNSTRRDAIEALICTYDSKAVDPLIQIVLNETDNSTRRDAIEALIYIYDSKVVDPLIQIALNEKDDYTRRQAVEALSNTNDIRVIAPLTRVALNEKDNYTRKIAEKALAKLKVLNLTTASAPQKKLAKDETKATAML